MEEPQHLQQDAEKSEHAEKHTKRLKRKRAIHKHLKDKMQKLKRVHVLQGVPKKFVEKIGKKGTGSEDKKSKGKTKEFTSGKFFTQLQDIAKGDAEGKKPRRETAPPSEQLSSRKLKL